MISRALSQGGFAITDNIKKRDLNVDNRLHIKDLPDEERPREKLFMYGVSMLSNPELIALILGNGTNELSALAVAEKLIALDKGGLANLAVCQPEEFCQIKGIGPAKAAQIAAAVELGKRIFSRPAESRIQVSCSSDVAGLLMKELRYLKKEVFKVILLNVKNEIIAIDDTAVGGLSSAYIHPREVFANAIKKGANSVILVHNHPSGNPEPSESDILLTQRLDEAGKIIGIKVADHVVIGNGRYKSIMSEYL